MRRQFARSSLFVCLAAALACGRSAQPERKLTPNELRAQLVAGMPADQDLVIVEVGGYGTGTLSSPELAFQCTTWTESALSALCWGFVSRDVQSVTVVATPDGASDLQAWAGACGGTATSCTPARQRLLDIGVSFAPKEATIPPPAAHQLSVEVAGEGDGSVGTTDAQLYCTTWTESSLSALCYSLVPNTAMPRQVTLQAEAAPGSVFAGWSGACGGESATCTVTMDRSRSVEARFAPAATAGTPPATQMLLVEVSGMGDGDVSASVALDCTEWTESALSRLCSAQVANTTPPTEVTLTAAPRQGSTFAGWEGACSGTASTCRVSMSRLVQVGARFEPGASQPPPTSAVVVSARIVEYEGSGYALELVAKGPGVAHVSATGPGVAPTALIRACSWTSDCVLERTSFMSKPAAGTVYTFSVAYTDGRREELTAQVHDLTVGCPRPVSPADAEVTTSATPTFSWLPPTTGCTSGYRVDVIDDASRKLLWHGSVPASTTSVRYDFDRTAAVPELGAGTYQWYVIAFDDCANAYPEGANSARARNRVFSVQAASPPVATSLAFEVQPSSTAGGQVMSPAVEVIVLDQYGAPFTSGSFPIRLTLVGNTAALYGTVTQSSAVGSATFADLAVRAAGQSYTLVASAPGLQSATSAAFAITGGAPVALWLGSRTDFMRAGDATLQADVYGLDAAGTFVPPPAAVTLSIASGPLGGALSGTTTVVPVGNVASFGRIIVEVAGKYAIRATSGTLQLDGWQLEVGAASPSASRSTLTANPTSAPADGTPISLRATFMDAYGNAVPGATVTFTASGTAAISPAAAVTGADGVASTTVTSTVAGTQTLTALVGTTTLATATVSFTEPRFTLGGRITGLSAAGLVLATAGEPNLTVPAGATSFTFANMLPSGTAYAVSVAAQPAGQSCTVSNATGTVTTTVTNVAVTCVAGTFTTTGGMGAPRSGQTATLLPNGRVLIAGGSGSSGYLATAELYDPATGKYMATGSMSAPRSKHTATLLANGLVLMTGADGSLGYLATAELYDPVTGAFRATGGMTTSRYGHTATLLPNGRVLITGGYASNRYLASAELYDPATGKFTPTGSMSASRWGHTATLLPNGWVLIAGGENLASAELYDPATGRFTSTGSMSTSRYDHTATLLPTGVVLVTGGGGSGGHLRTAELYDPATGKFAPTGMMGALRREHASTLLSNGRVLITGGDGGLAYLSTAEVYNPATGTFTATASMSAARGWHTSTLLPDGRVLLAGGADAGAESELYETAGNGSAAGTFALAGSMLQGRSHHTSTLLPNGKVLLAGGYGGGGGGAGADLYDPVAGTFTSTGSLTVARQDHTATLLPNGRVLIAGGSLDQAGAVNSLATAELYDPATGAFTATGSLVTSRDHHQAMLLPNGLVLITGGSHTVNGSLSTLAGAELYNPATGAFTATGSMANARWGATATLLSNGLVLVAGGGTTAAELYNPATGAFVATGIMIASRSSHSATKLPNGLILLAGGANGAPAELYDPATGQFAAAGYMATSYRSTHSATQLPNGLVLITGGMDLYGNNLAVSELYDPATRTFATTGSLRAARAFHAATLLPTGSVLITGGYGPTDRKSAELYWP